jgi:Ca-activated chloride channel family protein
MRRFLTVLAAALFWTAQARAHGLLIPEEKRLPPLAMLNHKVAIQVNDQVAVTKVEQTFRNHTSRQLEATYVFPVPKGASVNRFTMWVGGKEVKGELVEAKKARDIYNAIVRRTQDPGLLEYVGTNMLKMRVFPIPANSDQKVSLSYTTVLNRESGLVEYVYPLKTDGKATSTLEEFSITAEIKSQHGVQNVYSPTHAIGLLRRGDKHVSVTFDKKQGLLDRDFQLFYQLGDKDVGLTALTHRPVTGEQGYFMMLVTPKVELSKSYQVPRDMVLVLDTSGSMRGPKMELARKELNYCLSNLGPKDRFGVINFATTVNRYRDKLTASNPEQLAQAKKWVDELEATGGTAINDALASALEMRDAGDDSRTFTVVFFTDGLPTIGETNVDVILKNTFAKNTANTRIFTFGVGDDVNAAMLDHLADRTRALSTFVRPSEDIEAKVSGLYSKISHPVLANLKLATTGDVKISEVYPPVLPDLFHGTQLTVLGRYSGKGPSAIKLTGKVGKETKEFVYELSFPEKTAGEKEFVEQVWARRKVGFLLDQIRVNGEKNELVDEVVLLAKRYGITTPYTSYLIVPDSVVPVVRGDRGGFGGGAGGRGFVNPAFGPKTTPSALAPAAPGGVAPTLESFAREATKKPVELQKQREALTEKDLKKATEGKANSRDYYRALDDARAKKELYDRTRDRLKKQDKDGVQSGKDGVDLALASAQLRRQAQLTQSAIRQVQGRRLMEIGGVWIDEGFGAKTPTVTVKAQSDAYFKLLEKQPDLKKVLRLGNYLVFITPSGTALIIDLKHGKEQLSAQEIDKLFTAKK